MDSTVCSARYNKALHYKHDLGDLDLDRGIGANGADMRPLDFENYAL
jgi:hypothetical protein